MAQQFGFFEIIKNIQKKDEPLPRELIEEHFNSWLMMSYLSSCYEYVAIAESFSKLLDIGKYYQYLFLYHGIPKGSRFLQLEKKRKLSKEESDTSIIKEFYGISENKAKECIDIVLSLGLIDDMKLAINKGGKK